VHEITGLTREIKTCRIEMEKKQHELNLREMQVSSPVCPSMPAHGLTSLVVEDQDAAATQDVPIPADDVPRLVDGRDRDDDGDADRVRPGAGQADGGKA
jgi:hypothetical protein